jgi:hypothetical protein
LPLLRKEKALPNEQDFFLQGGQVVLCSDALQTFTQSCA